MNLRKKKVLFIDNAYHEYSKKIIKYLTKVYEVKELCLSPNLTLIEHVCFIKNKYKYITKKNSVLQRKYTYELDDDFDYVFVLTGRFLNLNFLKILKKKCYRAKLILYLWDSVSNIESIKNQLCYFDFILSFDIIDCKKYGFKFLPLFYSNDFINLSYNKIYDLFYCVNLRSDRIKLLKELDSFVSYNKINLKAFVLINYWRYLFYSLIKSDFRILKKYFIHNEICLKEFAKYMNESRACVDMQHVSQTGLTMRCIEALPTQTKIITTNEHIKEYDFYCPENVLIIDRENPIFNIDFIKSPYKQIPNEIVEKYSLENWVKQIFKD